MSRSRPALLSARGLALAVFAVASAGCLMVWLTGSDDDGHLGSSAPGVTASDHAPLPLLPEIATASRRNVRSPPARLAIAAIDVSTRVVRLGLQPDGSVEVPADPNQAGWFAPGPAPGGRGSAVILGHVDSIDGPAVFARLHELERGDVVQVRRADGSAVRFSVRRVVLYANAEFPAQRIYAAQGGRRLNLVTCGGDYDAARGGYQSNLVVYARRTHP